MKEMDDLGKDNKKRKGKKKKKYINLISKFSLEIEMDGWNTVDAQLCVGKENWRSLTIAGFDGRERVNSETRGNEKKKAKMKL